MYGNWKFETYDENEKIIAEQIRPLTICHAYRQEMKWLVELCGFEIVDIYKDYVWNNADVCLNASFLYLLWCI